jgi:NRPS condensation-like uncharacterized protein
MTDSVRAEVSDTKAAPAGPLAARHRFNIMLAVSCVEKNGKLKLSTDEYRLQQGEKINQNELGDFVFDRLNLLTDECKKNHEC